MMIRGAGNEISLGDVRVADRFFGQLKERIRTIVIPHMWELLNDRIPEARPSYCVRNFAVAARRKADGTEDNDRQGRPAFRGFESLPEDPAHPGEEFYGFVFQDSDLYKWIETVSYELMTGEDPALEALADEAVGLVCRAQLDNGYLDTRFIIGGQEMIFTNLKDYHELYCLGHLIEAGIAYRDATGKTELFDAAVRFADYACATFGREEGKRRGCPGHPLVEMALLRLYEKTGERRYRDLARYFLEERGSRPNYYVEEHPEMAGHMDRLRYCQAHLPVREQTEPVGHAVRAMYLYAGMADLARLAGDHDLFLCCRRLFEKTVLEKMYVTGAIGARSEEEAFSYPFDLPNDLAYAETCASAGLVFFAWRMLKIEADSRYADVMELALYNVLPASMSLDGKRFFYVNPLEVVPEACRKDPKKQHVQPSRQSWFGCACCPPNMARTIASVGRYAVTADDSCLWVHLYMGMEIRTEQVSLVLTTEYPENGTVRIEVTEDTGREYSLAFRIPGWCRRWEVHGTEDAGTELESGYLYCRKHWKKGDVLELVFGMEPVAVLADTKVREDAGKAAVMRGPVVYCLEEADNGRDLHELSIRLPLEASAEHVPELGGYTALTAAGTRTAAAGGGKLYVPYENMKKQARTLKLIPYCLWNNRGEGEMQVWVRYEEAI